MKVDPRFSLSIEDAGGLVTLRFAAAQDLRLDEGASRLFEAGFDELCELAGAPADSSERIAADPGRTILSNGWQSWAFGGELAAGERVPRPRLVPRMSAYCDGPRQLEARGEVLSRFMTYVRSGEDALYLVSAGDPGRATPPISFRIDRASLGTSAEACARGGSFRAGDLVARLCLFFRSGYFEAKDTLREVFSPYRHFERLAFLGSGERLVPGGYESWYNHYTAIDESVIERDLASIGSNANLINTWYIRRGKPTVFQIDDGWEKAVGCWEPDERRFSKGMGELAREIEERGMIPGLWIAPLVVTRSAPLFRERPEWVLRDSRGRPVPAGLNPDWDGYFYALDPSLPEVEEHLAGIFDTIVERWGYRYLKLDFLYTAFLEGSRTRPSAFARPGAAYEHYGRLMRRLTSKTTDSRGRGVAYLGCGAPLEPSFRHFPLMRIGADTKGAWEDPLLGKVVRYEGRPAAYANLTHTIGRSLLDGTVFVNDPDVVFCRTRRISLTEAEKESSPWSTSSSPRRSCSPTTRASSETPPRRPSPSASLASTISCPGESTGLAASRARSTRSSAGTAE